MPKRMMRADMEREYQTEARIAYIPYPCKVSRPYFEGLMAALPALTNHLQSVFFRKLLQYLLVGSLRDEETGNLVVPATLVAKLAGKKVGKNGFRAIDYLEDFSREIFPLVIGDFEPYRKSRTVDFVLPDAIIALQDEEDDDLDTEQEMVWLVSGLPVSPSSRRKHAERYEEEISYLSDGVDEQHPAYGLMRHLNAQPQTTLRKVVQGNWQRLKAMYAALPDETHDDHIAKIYVQHTLEALRDWWKMEYSPCESSARVVAKGTTIHCLPRAFRKAALSGCVEMDIRSSQLAIVAKLWNLPACQEFLAANDQSFWTMMLDCLGLSDDLKPSLKSSLYATCFGMGRQTLVSRLAFGHKKVVGIGADRAKQFFRHPLIKEILRGRSQRMREIGCAGGMEDAFGCGWTVSKEYPVHALLAIEAQSWELKLMLPLFEVVQAHPDARILSWLHDGAVVFHRDRRAAGGLRSMLRQCESTFNSNASSLGFTTDLEVTWL